MKKLEEVNQWYSLGIQLNVPISDLVKIEQTYTLLDKQKREMLLKWYSLGNDVSWQSLIRALYGIEEICLANKIASQLGKH